MRPKTTFFDGFLPEEDEAMRVAFDLFRRGHAEKGIDIASLLYGSYDPALAMRAEAMILPDRLAEIETLHQAFQANDARRFQHCLDAYNQRRVTHSAALRTAFETVSFRMLERNCAMEGKAVTLRLRIEEEPGRIDAIQRATDSLFADVVRQSGDEVIALMHTPPTLMMRITRLYEADHIPDRTEELEALKQAWRGRDVEHLRPLVMTYEMRRAEIMPACRHRFIEELAQKPLLDGKTMPPIDPGAPGSETNLLPLQESLFMEAAMRQGDAEVIAAVERHYEAMRPLRVMALFVFSFEDQLGEYDRMEAAFQAGDLATLRGLKDAHDERIEVIRPLMNDLLHYTARRVQ